MRKLNLIFITLLMSLSFNIFGQDQTVVQNNEKSVSENMNRFSIMLSDVLVRRISLEYEHVMTGGHMSLNIPFSVTVSPFEDLWSDEVHWWAGMGVKFYPTGQGVVRYFLGPEFRLISVTENNYSYDYDPYYVETENQGDYINTVFLINNGMIYSPTNEFFVSINMGVGFLSRSNDSSNESLVPFAAPSFRLGFKF